MTMRPSCRAPLYRTMLESTSIFRMKMYGLVTLNMGQLTKWTVSNAATGLLRDRSHFLSVRAQIWKNIDNSSDDTDQCKLGKEFGVVPRCYIFHGITA